jgi:hypothetical protein
MALMMLVVMVALGALTMATAATSIALSAVGRADVTTRIKTMIIGAGVIAFIYAWYAVGSLDNEQGVEYIFSFILKLALCLIAATIIIGTIALWLRMAVGLQRRTSLLTLPFYALLAIGIIFGFAVVLFIENLIIGDWFMLDIIACTDYALVDGFGEFGWCIEASRP